MRPVFADPKTDLAGLTEAEHEAYERAKMAEQDARGALEKAKEEGMAQGMAQGIARGMDEGRCQELRRSLADLCELLSIEMTDERQEVLTGADLSKLETLRSRIVQERRWPVS